MDVAVSDEYTSRPITVKGGWYGVAVRAGDRMFKGMTKTKWTVSDPENPYSSQSAWFSTRQVAMQYKTDRGKDARTAVYEFTATHDLFLILLCDSRNLSKISDILDGDGLVATHPALWRAFQVCTGWGVTEQAQQAFFRDYGKLTKHVFKSRPLVPRKLTRFCSVDATERGFKRVSVNTSLDRLMLKAICQATGQDGYICYNAPTFIEHPAYAIGYIHEEIGVCRQVDNIELVFGHVIPTYIGMSGFIQIDGDDIVKWIMPDQQSVEQKIERELAANTRLSQLQPGFATYDEVLKNEEYGWTGFKRALRESDLHRYWMVNYRTMTWGDIQSHVTQLLVLLEKLRLAQIVHYDLKLENVLIDGGQIEIADFGTTVVVGTGDDDERAKRDLARNIDLIRLNSGLLVYALSWRHLQPWQTLLIVMSRLLGNTSVWRPALKIDGEGPVRHWFSENVDILGKEWIRTLAPQSIETSLAMMRSMK